MTSVAVGGIVAEVEGDGFPVIMIHGLGATSNMFQPQMETLRPYRVIRVDLPGSGRSPVPAEMPTFEGFAEQVVGVAKLLGVTQAHFVGHSMGTIVCQMVAANPAAGIWATSSVSRGTWILCGILAIVSSILLCLFVISRGWAEKIYFGLCTVSATSGLLRTAAGDLAFHAGPTSGS